MKSKFALSVLISCALVMLVAGALQPAEAKKWTITQRLEALSKEIDTGRKANELTTKEVDKLKDETQSINDTIRKMQNKNGGKLSPADNTKLEKRLNKLSLRIQKLRLDKRAK